MSKSNLNRWITRITRSSRRGLHKQTLSLFQQMQSLGFELNRYILPSLLRSCSSLTDLKTGRTLHGFITRALLSFDPFITSSLIDLYYKCGKLDSARKVFDIMPQRDRDLVVWNSMVSGYAHFGFSGHALVLVLKMQSCGLRPDLFTWNALISGFSQSGNDAMALDLFRSMQIDGIAPDVFFWISIIPEFVRNFSYDQAFDMFNVCSGPCRMNIRSNHGLFLIIRFGLEKEYTNLNFTVTTVLVSCALKHTNEGQ